MLELIRKRLKSRTYRVAIMMGIATALEANFQVLVPLLPAAIQPYAALIWAVAMLVMREATKEPIAAK